MNAITIDQQAALQGIEENGFYLARGVVSKAGLATLESQIKAEHALQVSNGRLFDGGGTISGHLNCFPGAGARFVLDDLRASGVLDVIRSVSPNGADWLRPNCNVNLPGSVAQHYHIDGYYSLPFYICTVAVVDTDETNGALDVLPATHRRYYKFWQYALTRTYKLSTRVPMRQGDVLIRKSTVWHRGMPNHTQAMRPQLTFTFGEGSAPKGDPFSLNDGGIFFEPNWFGTSKLSQVRERIFVRAPLTYSAYRFVRSLVGKKGYAPEKRFGDFTQPPKRRFSPWRRPGVAR